MYENIPVILKDLPVHIHGFVCLGSDYEPIIFINAKLSHEQQAETYRHEMRHIENGDLYNENFDDSVEYGDAV